MRDVLDFLASSVSVSASLNKKVAKKYGTFELASRFRKRARLTKTTLLVYEKHSLVSQEVFKVGTTGLVTGLQTLDNRIDSAAHVVAVDFLSGLLKGYIQAIHKGEGAFRDLAFQKIPHTEIRRSEILGAMWQTTNPY